LGSASLLRASLEFTPWKGSGFFILVDYKACSGYFDIELLDGLSERFSPFEDFFHKQHTFLDITNDTLMGILEYSLLF